jgi:hypothetical protein
LQLLWLQRCSIQDSAFSLLSEGLNSLPHLHTLDLSVNRLTDASIPDLASCLPCMRAMLSLRCVVLTLSPLPSDPPITPPSIPSACNATLCRCIILAPYQPLSSLYQRFKN